MLNTETENKFQLLVQNEWEDWIVLKTYCRGARCEITHYDVARLKDESEHRLTYEKVEELFNNKKLCLR